MDLFASVDLYCERTGPEFWSEPLNLFSNITYLLLAIVAHRRINREAVKLVPQLKVLLVLCYAVGPASAVFHSFATIWAQIVDVTPIGLFFLYYTFFTLRHAFSQAKVVVVSGLIAFVIVSTIFANLIPGELVNGSQIYFGGVVGAIAFGIAGSKLRLSFGKRYYHLASVFVLALCFRIVDLKICPFFEYGTHFLWHISTAVVTWLAMDIAITYFKELQSEAHP